MEINGTCAKSPRQEPFPSPIHELAGPLMPAFFDSTLAPAMDGGFIREGKIDEALQRLIPHPSLCGSASAVKDWQAVKV